MVDYPQDSIQLMKKIMDVQEELDRFRSGSTSRSSSIQKPRGHHNDKLPSPKASKPSDHKHRSHKENHKLDLKLDYNSDLRNENIHISSAKAKGPKLSSSAGPEGNPYESENRHNKDSQAKRPPSKPYKHAMEQLKDITKEISNEIHKQSHHYRSNAASPYHQDSDLSISVNRSKANHSALNHSEYMPDKNSKRGTPKQEKHEKGLIPAKVAFNNLLSKVNAISFVSQRGMENDPELESIIKGSASNRKSPSGSNTKRNKSARGEKPVSPNSYKKLHEDHMLYKLENGLRKKLEFGEEIREKNEARASSIENKQKSNLSYEKKTIFEIPSSIVQANKFFKDDDKFFKQRDSVKEIPPETIPPKAQLNPQVSFKSNFETKKHEVPAQTPSSDKADANLIIELKNKIHAKELEIIELKNSRLQNDMENQNLLLQIKDQLTDNKRNEELIEKLRTQISMQDKEIDILRKTKKILEGNKLDMEQVAESQMVKKLEYQLEEKKFENLQLQEQLAKAKMEKKQIIEEERNHCFNEVEKLKEELIKKETALRNAQAEIERNKDKMLEYSLIDKKIFELEDMQNTLIEENDHLKETLAARQKPLKELERQGENIDRELITFTLALRRKLLESDELSKSLISLLQATVKDQELPIELILKHNRTKGKEKPFNDNELKALTLKELNQQNVNMCDGMNRNFQQSMDQICDDYASKYGNQCNVQ